MTQDSSCLPGAPGSGLFAGELSMIQLKNLSLRRGAKELFSGVSLTITPGQRVGIIGGNGTGKSSLFALLRGQLHADSGDALFPAGWTVAHVAQETPALDCSALTYVLDGDSELRQLEQQLSAAEAAHDGEAIGRLHSELAVIDAYSAPARAGKLLAGLGFSAESIERPVASFSGGWRMRLNLAQALMCRSDLLLLDEPTNHLDLEAVLWLEQWLAVYPGTLLLISHDREFLDAITTQIIEVARGQMAVYTGNYSNFEDQRAERLAQQQQAFEKQQRTIAHLESFITRFKAKATKAKQAQSRVKALARLERVAAAHIDNPFDFCFEPPEHSPNPLLQVELADIGYGDTAILRRVSLSVEAGARIGLLGPNGAGKSTLVKLLAGELTPLCGQLKTARELKIGYFAQHQLDTLREEESPLWHMQKLAPSTREQELRNFLGGFNFIGDMATAPIGPLSGGEKSRLALALIVWQRPNLLLLDEPTNHLDLDMRAALTLALQDFVGSLIVVSHDRALLETTTDQYWLIDAGQVKPFDGDLADYRAYRLAQQAADAAPRSSGTASSEVDRKTQKRQEAEARQRLSERKKPLVKQLTALERDLATLNSEKTTLDAQLADEAIYSAERKTELQTALKRQGEVSARLAEQEEAWLLVHMEIEALEAELGQAG